MAVDMDKRSLTIEMVMIMMKMRLRSLQVNLMYRREGIWLRLHHWYPAVQSLPPTIIEKMEDMFLRIGFSQTVAMKLVDDQWIDSHCFFLQHDPQA